MGKLVKQRKGRSCLSLTVRAVILARDGPFDAACSIALFSGHRGRGWKKRQDKMKSCGSDEGIEEISSN